VELTKTQQDQIRLFETLGQTIGSVAPLKRAGIPDFIVALIELRREMEREGGALEVLALIDGFTAAAREQLGH
jgi:hypothetical protein